MRLARFGSNQPDRLRSRVHNTRSRVHRWNLGMYFSVPSNAGHFQPVAVLAYGEYRVLVHTPEEYHVNTIYPFIPSPLT
jgi:hypothetical protein